MNKRQLQQLIASGDTRRALEALLAAAQSSDNNSLQNDALHLLARFNAYEKQVHAGTEDSSTLQITLNRIHTAALDLIRRLPEGDLPVPDSPRPTPQPQPSAGIGDGGAKPQGSATWIVGLVLLAGIIALALYIPYPSGWQKNVFHIALSLAAAGVAAIIPGFIELEHKGFLRAGGALAVFCIVFFFKPAPTTEDEPFTVTVFVHGKGGLQDMILRQQGHVVMDVDGDRRREAIGENGQAYLPKLHVGDTLRLNVDFSEPYKADYPDSQYVVKRDAKIYLQVSLQGLDKVYGYVVWKDLPLEGVEVSINNLKDMTNASGYYEIAIPEVARKKEQEVRFFKKGFKLLSKKAFPQTQEPLNVVMEKTN